MAARIRAWASLVRGCRCGLNQYSSVSGTAFSYDTSGNLTSDGVRTFGYDIDNHMISGTAQVALQNGFSPLGRRLWAEAAGQTAPTYFVYDGEDISEEYANGVVLRRRMCRAGSAKRRW